MVPMFYGYSLVLLLGIFLVVAPIILIPIFLGLKGEQRKMRRTIVSAISFGILLIVLHFVTGK
jgi:small neutral amino acid transporter SnatA (MarC family)